MSTDVNINHRRIKKLLDGSASRIRQSTLSQLEQSRNLALTRFDERHAAPAFAWAGAASWHGFDIRHKTHALAAAVLLIAVLFSAASYWNWNYVAETDNSAVDIAILTGDLPMHVYVD